MAERSELHTRNKHNRQYDFSLLTENYPPLRKFVLLNPLGIQTIDFFNPHAVKALNKALLISYYGIRYWDIQGIICVRLSPGGQTMFIILPI